MLEQRPLRLAAVIEARTVTGPAKNLIRFCKGAQQEGSLDPLLLTFVRGPGDNPFLEAAHAAGLKVVTIPERRRFDIRILSALRQQLTSFRPDLLQTHSVKSHFLVRMGGLHKVYPWIAFHHGYTATDWKMKAYNQLDRWSLGVARTVMTVCGPFAVELRGSGVPAAKIRILHNSVELPGVVPDQEQEALRNKLGLTAQDRVVLSIGRFSQEKGHKILVDAFAQLRQTHGEARLVLVGEGPEEGALRQQVEKRGLKGAVVFAGQVRHVWPYFALAEVFALPSFSEGSPNVLLEAFAAGVPVVSTDVGGVGELVEDGQNGFLVGPAQPEALADKMAQLLAHPEVGRRMAAEGQRRVAERYTPEAYRKALLKIYRQSLGAGG